MDNNLFQTENSQRDNFSQLPENQNLPQKPKNSLTKILLVILVIVLVGIVTYVGIQYSQKNIDEVYNEISTLDDNNIENWKTYKNMEYGFEFKYPPNLNETAQRSSNFSLKLIDTKTCGTTEVEGSAWPKDCIRYNLGIQKNNIWGSENSTTIEIAGRSMERIEINDGMWESSNQTVYQFVKNGDWFINSLTFNSANKTDAENLFKQILSTFKFTTPPSNLTVCNFIKNSTFTSVAEKEVGLGPNNKPAMGYWSLTFGENEVAWHHSDVVEKGTFICEDSKINIKIGGFSLIIAYDKNNNKLIFQGDEYIKK